MRLRSLADSWLRPGALPDFQLRHKFDRQHRVTSSIDRRQKLLGGKQADLLMSIFIVVK
jgi:hypothetical protein